MLQITITDHNGTRTDNRPGHSIAGLHARMDPFLRHARLRLDRVSRGIVEGRA